jgi:large subunit ribosomal protein L29
VLSLGRIVMVTGQLTNNRRLRVVRHEIARIYTVMRERELGLATGPADKGDAARERRWRIGAAPARYG